MPTSKSTRSPAFQFYPGDFLSSSKVQRMSLTEMGAYLKLLCLNWLDGSLPDDVAILASMVGLKQPQFAKMWAGPLHECFEVRGGRLVNPRLEKERKAQAEFRKKQKDKADIRWDKHRNTTIGNATALPERHPRGNALQSSSSSSSSSSNTPANAGVARAPIHTSHRNHAHCGRVCLPASLFSEFVRRRNHADADREIRDWAMVVEAEWGPDGPRASEEPGDSFEFWKARYADKWPAMKVDSRLPAWAR